jgi:GDPmannose 4,6-dehydratase
VGKEIVWRGSGVTEQGFEARSGRILVEIDPRYFRPTEVDLLIGDPTKARKKFGWRHKVSFDALVAEMVRADLQLVAQEAGIRVASFYSRPHALRMAE